MGVLRRRGLVYRATEILLPVATVAKSLHLNRLISQILNFAVRLYQKFLSPHKGFTCAHRKLYREASCSEYFRQAIATEGLADAIPLFQQRLFDCKQARQELIYRSLSQQMAVNKRKRRKNQCDADCLECGCELWDCSDMNCNGIPDCLEGCSFDACDCGGCDCG